MLITIRSKKVLTFCINKQKTTPENSNIYSLLTRRWLKVWTKESSWISILLNMNGHYLPRIADFLVNSIVSGRDGTGDGDIIIKFAAKER
jgi:hypothetical protein